MLRLAGAELVEVPAVPYREPEQLREGLRPPRRAAREERAERRDLGQPVRQRRQPPAPISRRTGPEIWEQTDGKVDGFVCAVGTGGTLAGVGMALKERNPNVTIALADPMGAALYSLLHDRRAQGRRLLDHRGHRPGPHHRAISKARRSTRAYQIPDDGGGADRLRPARARGPVPRRLVRHQRRRRHPPRPASSGPGHTIVTVLCDYGTRYQSKLFNPEFLRSKNLPVPAWLERGAGIDPGLVPV